VSGYESPYDTGPGVPYRSTTMATVAFVLALVTLLPVFGFATGLAAFIVGLVALSRIRRGEAAGRGRAIAAVVISVVLFLLQVLLVIFAIGLATFGVVQDNGNDGGTVSTALLAFGLPLLG